MMEIEIRKMSKSLHIVRARGSNKVMNSTRCMGRYEIKLPIYVKVMKKYKFIYTNGRLENRFVSLC